LVTKEEELFDIDTNIEDSGRQIEKYEKDHKDTIQYKDEIYSKFSNNQDRALKDLKIQFETINKCIEDVQRVNKDSQNIEELAKAVGLDKTDGLLNEKSKAPYDELKLRETNRENEDLKQKLEQGVKDLNENKIRLVELRNKNNEMGSKIEIFSNFKILNSEIKDDVQRQQEEIRRQEKEEVNLKSQNSYLESILKTKNEEAASLEESVKLFEQLVEAHGS